MIEIPTVVADDEPLARRGVCQLLRPYPEVRIVGEAADGREAVHLVRSLAPLLLFLDVQMPELDAFGVLEERAVRRVPAVVFLTAYSQFAVRAFDVDAVDYLLKPVRAERLRLCMGRVRARLDRHQAKSGAGDRDDPLADAVVVPTKSGSRLLYPDEIDWVEAADYYAIVHAQGEQFLIRESISALEGRLPPTLFLRVHRSALLNVARIRGVSTAGRPEVILRDGTHVPVSRRRKGDLMTRLKGLLEGGT
jgi:two-component system LytT family response regulator